MQTTLSDSALLTLATITTRDQAGRHFYELFDPQILSDLEAAGLIEIYRPVHEQTGLPYSTEYHRVKVTDDGREYLDSHYDSRDYVAVRVDDECNAEWWANLRELYPQFAAHLADRGKAILSSDAHQTLTEIPGYHDGPSHAPTALYVLQDLASYSVNNPLWSDLV